MSKLEKQLRESLISVHVEKAAEFIRRADIAINHHTKVVLMQHAEQHLEDAAQLRAEGKELAS